MSGIFDPSHYAFNFYAIPPLLVGSIIFLLGVGTLIWEHGERVSRSFFLLTFSAAVWLAGYGVAYLADDPATALVWIQVSHFGVSLIPSCIFLFTLILLGRAKTFLIYAGISFFLSALLYFGGLWTHSWITGVSRYFWGYYARFGPMGAPFLLFFFIVLLASLALLWKGYREAVLEKGPRRRLKAFLLAFLVGYLASVDYLAAFGVPVYPFGYLAVMAFIVMSAYAIRRYHLVGITPAIAAQQILETMQGAVLVTDLKGIIRVVNKTACRMFGYQEPEALGMPIASIIETPFDLKVGPGGRKAEIISPTFVWASGEIRNHGIIWRAKDGKKIHVSMSASPLRDTRGSIEGMVYVGLDITELKNVTEALQTAHDLLEKRVEERTTELVEANKNLYSEIAERKRVEDALKKAHDELEMQVLRRTAELSKVNLALKGEIAERKKAEEMRLRLASIVESTDDSILSMTLDGIIMSWNRGAEKVYGYPAGEMIGQSFTRLIPKDYSEEIRGILNRIWEGGQLENYETRRVRKDGRLIDVSLTLSPLKDETGRMIGISSIGRDITKLKQAEEAIRQKKDTEIKSGFVSMVSHELRTPLTAIKMGIDILMVGEAGTVTPEQKEWLEMAQRNVERLTRLINHVLDFQKLDAEKMPTDYKVQDMNELVRELEMTLRALAHHKNLAFTFELEEGLAKVSFDREKISEVLMNLVANAVKFTDQGKILLKTGKKEDGVEVSVSDTGIGIRSQDMPKLFTHFTQLHGDHGKTGGTGLGLAISKKIIDQHGGVIGARSEHGKGSTFYFRLLITEPVK